jgi:hypothetical protein
MRVSIQANPNKSRGKPYHWNLGEAISQMFGAIFGLNANLTFSSYCGYWFEQNKPFLKYLHKPVNFLFRDPNHCQEAWKKMT